MLCIKLDPFPSHALPQFLPFALFGLSISMFLKAEVSTAFLNLLPENIFFPTQVILFTVLTVPFRAVHSLCSLVQLSSPDVEIFLSGNTEISSLKSH